MVTENDTHSGHIYEQEIFDTQLSMASDLRLSDYASELSISNKRRYLEKISGIQDPYSIPASELMKNVFPPVTNTDIFNYLVLGHSFCTS